MKSFFNLERSGFDRSAYIGYACGTIFTIRRSRSSYGAWWGVSRDILPGHHIPQTVFGHTLADVSQRLAAMDDDYKKGVAK